MCFTLGLGLALAQTAVSTMAQAQEANAQNEYAYKNARSAIDAEILKFTQEQQRQREEEANKTRQRQEAWREGENARGTALASSQNEGNSLNMTLGDLTRQSLRQINVIDADAKIDRQQGLDNLYGIQKEAESRIAGVQTTSGPSLLSMAVSGLGAFANASDPKRTPTKPRGYGNSTKNDAWKSAIGTSKKTKMNPQKDYLFSDYRLGF